VLAQVHGLAVARKAQRVSDNERRGAAGGGRVEELHSGRLGGEESEDGGSKNGVARLLSVMRLWMETWHDG